MTTTPASAAALGIDVRPMSGHIGAEIHGVDLTHLTPESVAEIRAALLQWKVVFFRDQDLTQAQHIAFAPPVRRRRRRPTRRCRRCSPTTPRSCCSTTSSGSAAAARTARLIESRWHTDVTFVPNPPMGSILRGVVVPPYGGDTQWINLASRTSGCRRRSSDSSTACTPCTTTSCRSLRGEMSPELAKQFPVDRHPLRAPGRARAPGDRREGAVRQPQLHEPHRRAVAPGERVTCSRMLYEHMTNAEFTCRFRWEPGSIAFWDNRATAPPRARPTSPRACTARCSASPSPATSPSVPTANPVLALGRRLLMSTATALRITPEPAVLGATVDGIDLSGPLAAELVAEVRAALNQYQVLFFPEQNIAAERQVKLGRRSARCTPTRCSARRPAGSRGVRHRARGAGRRDVALRRVVLTAAAARLDPQLVIVADQVATRTGRA